MDDNTPESNNLEQTEADIIKYLDDNNLEAEKTELGVYYIIDAIGDGVKPTSDAFVTVSYKGYLLEGQVFEQTDADGVKLDLLSVIQGFKDGILQFNEGGEGTLIIPPNLGFGDFGTGTIPGGAVLLFDFKLLNVDNPDTEEDIIAYINENELDATRTESGLYYTVEEPGEGDEITITSKVTITYKGYFLDGTEFNSTEDSSGIEVYPINLIPGFKEGLTNFKKGGKGTLLLTPELAYGETGTADGKVPRNTALIFDIEILDVVPPASN